MTSESDRQSASTIMVDRQGKVSQRPKSPKPLSSLPIPSPSASILLISPTNEILLLHRVQTSSSFASAHVFPGGHLSPQDGPIPPVEDIRRHEDSDTYRMSALRECFEESGILLATSKENPGKLLEISDKEREDGRHAVHENRIDFRTWVDQHGGVSDTENLIPFTRWLTPSNLAKRFTTQMYLYFLPLPSTSTSTLPSSRSTTPPLPATIHNPTPDGGLEHTAAAFHPPSTWLSKSLSRPQKCILYPPQFFLLHLLSPFLAPSPTPCNLQTVRQQRAAFFQWMNQTPSEGEVSWGMKCISPVPLVREGSKGFVMDLALPGPELEGSRRVGEMERVIRVGFEQGRAEPKEILRRKDVLEQRERFGNL